MAEVLGHTILGRVPPGILVHLVVGIAAKEAAARAWLGDDVAWLEDGLASRFVMQGDIIRPAIPAELVECQQQCCSGHCFCEVSAMLPSGPVTAANFAQVACSLDQAAGTYCV